MKRVATFLSLAMLTQPAWGYSIETLLELCTKWENNGYSDQYELNKEGVKIVECSIYMTAMRDVGLQNCSFLNHAPGNFGWSASKKQLAQFFLNNAREHPERWKYVGYSFFIFNEAYKTFPCEK